MRSGDRQDDNVIPPQPGDATAAGPDAGLRDTDPSKLRRSALGARAQTAIEVSKSRRAIAERSPALFAQLYLKHHFKLPESRMHKEMFEVLGTFQSKRGQRVAIAAPRGHAKTTVLGLAYVLWCAIYQREQLIVLVSATSQQATQMLRNIKEELLNNPLLQRDFPEVCGPLGTSGGPKPFTGIQIVLPDVAQTGASQTRPRHGGGVTIRALGADQRMRGLRQRQHRPGLIIVDDLEDASTVLASESRRKTREWFEGTLLKLGNPDTNVVVVGTVLHYDSLLASLINLPGSQPVTGWTGMIYRAIEHWSTHPELWEQWQSIFSGSDEHPPPLAVQSGSPAANAAGKTLSNQMPAPAGSPPHGETRTGEAAAQAFYLANTQAMLEDTRVLWPELEDYAHLMKTMVREGRSSFDAEKQNQPTDPKQCVFREENFRYWDDEFGSPAQLAEHFRGKCRLFAACDPSLGGQSGRGDFSAIVTLIKPYNSERMYVVDASIQRCTPDELLVRIIELARIYKYGSFFVEANGFQELLSQQLRDRARDAGVSVSVRSVINRTDKRARIMALEPLICQGHLLFSRRQQLLIEQLRQFPLAAHDDGPDALEMVVSKIREQGPRITVSTRDPFCDL